MCRCIGAAIVRKFASEGAAIAFTYISSGDKTNSIIEALKGDGVKALAIKADSGNVGEITAAVTRTAEYFGRFDILVNNAGLSIMGDIDQAGELEEQFDKQIDVNVKGLAAAIRKALKHISNNGRIITMGPLFGSVLGLPTAADYGVSKAAAAAYSRGYAWDFGSKGITLNTVQPGPIDTEMNPDAGEFAHLLRNRTALKRYGTADEIASGQFFSWA